MTDTDVYSYTQEQIAAMWDAYQSAPDDTTVGDLRTLMDKAAEDAITPPAPTEYSREELIELCIDGIVPQAKWYNRDSAKAQRQLGEARALLTAGCNYRILREEGGMNTGAETVWIEIEAEGFAFHDCDGDLDRDTYYLPTRRRLRNADGGDWY